MTTNSNALAIVAASNRAILDQIAADPKNQLAAQILESYEGVANPPPIVLEKLITLIASVVNYLATFMPALKTNFDNGAALPIIRPNPWQAQIDAADAATDAAIAAGALNPPGPHDIIAAIASILEQINVHNMNAVQVIDMHNYILHTLLKCAKVQATFINQPPNANGLILRSIEGQTIHGAIAALLL